MSFNKAVLTVRVPVGQLRTEIGRGGREMRGMSGSEESPGGLHRGAFPRGPTLLLPTESGMGQNRQSLTQPHGSPSLVSFLLRSQTPICPFNKLHLLLKDCSRCVFYFEHQMRSVLNSTYHFREHVATRNFSCREGTEGEHAPPSRSSCQRIVLGPHSPSRPVQNFHIPGEKTHCSFCRA